MPALGGLCPGTAKQRDRGKPLGLVRGRCWDREGAQHRELALCQLLLLPTDQTWEGGPLDTSLFILSELWVENSGSLRIMLLAVRSFEDHLKTCSDGKMNDLETRTVIVAENI